MTDLCALIEDRTFIEDHWDRAPLFQAGQAERFEELITVADVDHAVATGLLNISYSDARKGEGRTYLTEGATPPRPATDAYLARLSGGATLILDGAERQVPGLGTLCRRLMARTGHPWHCNLYVTPPGGQGFAGHVDDTGVFILQIFGAKHWRYGHAQVSRPVRGGEHSAAPEGWEADAQEATLTAGDLLYLPRGVAHAASTSAEGSLHVTLTISEVSWAQAAGAGAGTPDDPLRQLLPLGFHHDEAALAEGLGLRGIEEVEAKASDFLDRLAGRFRPDFSGRLSAALHPQAVNDQTALAPVPDLWWRLSPRGETVQLICGPIRLDLPTRAAEAVRAALEQPVKVAGLPGALSDPERIALAKCLLEHGLALRGGP